MAFFSLRTINIILSLWTCSYLSFVLPSGQSTEAPKSNFVEERQAIGEALGALISSLVKPEIYQGQGPGPCVLCDTGPGCIWMGGDGGMGNKWATCWSEGTDTFFDFDAAASDCLTNLHSTQSDVCISIAGSSCAQGYGGGTMNSQVTVGNTQLSSQQSATIQVAIANFVQNSTFDLNSGVTFAAPTPDFAGTTEEMNIYGHGAAQC